MGVERSLAHLGFDHSVEAQRLNSLPPEERVEELESNLRSSELHVARDHPVSLPYPYWLTDGEIFTNLKKGTKLEIDEKERGGFCRQGITLALEIAYQHPDQLVFLYSSPGLASFESPSPEKYQKPYDIGQLYLMSFDGEKVVNFAISLNKEGERWLNELFSELYDQINSMTDIQKKIIAFITTPVLSNFSFEDFLRHEWENKNIRIFSKKNHFGGVQDYTLAMILDELEKSKKGQLRASINTKMIAERVVTEGGSYVSSEAIKQAYFQVYAGVMEKENVKQLFLGGGCGGSVISYADLLEIIPVLKLEEISNLSSNYRQMVQRSFSGKNKDQEDFICPNCGEKSKPPVGDCCPHCGITKKEAEERGLTTC